MTSGDLPHSDFTTLAGTPIASTSSGISFVTTDPAATVTPFPIETPGMTRTFPPIHVLSPIFTGKARVR